ncbi:Outer membrane porin F [Kordia antarctica]|uniref:Outer membrane porin F n=1 Tax=Kordia antarctica TaxID=1218801 RepID=A0A7L4ZFC5_9FLAO|nr:OmpA family protein [Kordia antarctica]QHI35131.1 Outer membrane porin F [Kordia antarctica]
MKQYYNIFTLTLLLAFCTQSSFSQDTDKSWFFDAGFTAVDLFPVGEDAPQGEFLDEFINANDHWNFGYYAGVSRNLTNNLSLSLRGTVSEISKYGEFGELDESVLVDNLKYYGIDGMINYSFGKSKLRPFIAVGGGYTWLEGGSYNTFSVDPKALIGAGTVNGSVGLKYWVSDKFGINVQTTYKHSFKDYLPRHWNHNFGISYRLDTSKDVEDNTVEATKMSVKPSRWSFEIGLSAIDLYPVGEDAPQGEYFDEFFNLNDHWNLGFYVGATRNLTDNFSITAKGTVAEISKYGEFGELDESVLVDNLKYYGLDAMANYSFGKGKLQPFVAVGGGYTWLEEGPYNNNGSSSNSLVGAGTVNGSVGVKYWFNDRIGLNVQTTYKHSLKDYLPKHFNHNLGLVYNLGKSAEKEEEEDDNDRDKDGIPNDLDLCPDTFGIAEFGGCPDTDGDGVSDKDDLCPEVKGLIEFGGCPDSDGDGFPDNKDNCPEIKGTLNGCPPPVVEIPVVKPVTGQRKVYFNTDSTKLDLNAQAILDEIATSLTSDTDYNISIQGHADARGTDNYNINLSLARAKAIKSYLDSKNLGNSTISISAKGESQPVAPNTTADGRARNRRVEIIIDITAK